MIPSAIFHVLLLCFPFLAHVHGDLDEQILALTEQLKQSPSSATLLVDRAELHRLHLDLKACREDLLSAAQQDPEHNRLLLVLARLELDSQRCDLALPPIETLLARASCRGELRLSALHHHARVLTEAQLPQRAIVAWDLLLEEHPRPQPDWFLLRASLQNSTEALLGLENGMLQIGQAVSLVLRASEIEELLGLPQAASQRIQPLLDASARKETWLARQGDILLRGGEVEAARKKFLQAQAAIQLLRPKQRNTLSMRRLGLHLQQSLAELEL